MNMHILDKIGQALTESPKAFRLTPSPTLIMTLLVKNEEDVLEENLLFHKAMGVDGFIITDNNSTDRTMDIIEKYRAKGWVKEVINESATNYEQKKWVDRMIRKAKQNYGADWVVNADADELWYSPAGNLKKELSVTHANVLDCEMRSAYPEEGKPFWEWTKMVKPVDDPRRYGLSAYSIFTRQYKKVIHRTTCYLQISMGNHKVVMLPKRSVPALVRVYHYNVRGEQHFIEKMVNGGLQLEHQSSQHVGRHWRYFYKLYQEGRLKGEYARVIGAHAYDRLCADGFIYRDTTIADFFREKDILKAMDRS